MDLADFYTVSVVKLVRINNELAEYNRGIKRNGY